MPYTVVGFWIVSLGVGSLGVSSPKAAMELGATTRSRPFSAAASRTLWRPLMLTSWARRLSPSATADSIELMWKRVSTSYSRIALLTCPKSVTSMVVHGPDSWTSSCRLVSNPAATTLSLPYRALSAGTRSEPICPAAPVTRILFIGSLPTPGLSLDCDWPRLQWIW